MMTLDIPGAAEIGVPPLDAVELLVDDRTPVICAEHETSDAATDKGNGDVAPDCLARSKDMAVCDARIIRFRKKDVVLYHERINIRLLKERQSARTTTFWAPSPAARSILDALANCHSRGGSKQKSSRNLAGKVDLGDNNGGGYAKAKCRQQCHSKNWEKE